MSQIRRSLRLTAALATGVALLTVSAGATALASDHSAVAARGSPNPLAGRPWVASQGPSDETWLAYSQASAADQPLLAKIALQPRVRWFGDWVPTGSVRDNVAKQIADAQGGDPETLVPIADFKVKPWEGDACHALPSAASRPTTRRGPGSSRPGSATRTSRSSCSPDGPFALCAPHHSKLYSHLIRYGVKTLATLPNTSVHLDAGASDWLRNDPAQALKILVPAG